MGSNAGAQIRADRTEEYLKFLGQGNTNEEIQYIGYELSRLLDKAKIGGYAGKKVIAYDDVLRVYERLFSGHSEYKAYSEQLEQEKRELMGGDNIFEGIR